MHIRSLGGAPASIWELNASQVRDLTASLSPTPGAGSISVFAATLGLALVHKGASLSLKRAGDDINRYENLTRLCEHVISALASMSSLADEDSQAFQEYVVARSLPRSSDTENVLRKAAMEAAILHATRVPLASADSICKALEYAKAAVQLSDRHLLSDVYGGAIIMQAGAKALFLTAKANVLLLADDQIRVAIEGEMKELEGISYERSEAVSRAYEGRMSDSIDLTGR